MIIKWQFIVLAYIFCFVLAIVAGIIYVHKNNKKDNDVFKDSDDYSEDDILNKIKIIHE